MTSPLGDSAIRVSNLGVPSHNDSILRRERTRSSELLVPRGGRGLRGFLPGPPPLHYRRADTCSPCSPPRRAGLTSPAAQRVTTCHVGGVPNLGRRHWIDKVHPWVHQSAPTWTTCGDVHAIGVAISTGGPRGVKSTLRSDTAGTSVMIYSSD